ncbi:uncharacterized protein LOC119375648 [Rhipicephalus sanguineus]|uniref:uncharacterized protein LOC119375648 n=1 Tax=Rhipicephalus sanguineus TaxID=34632 RepID=UPI0018953BA0|nr:uncharacterized protein LOC119375648 [Rhipicephalus sanguineus]
MRVGVPACLLLMVCSINAQLDQIRRRPFSSPATGCLENRLLRLRLECEGSLDDVARLRMKRDQSESCRKLRKYITCIDMALTSTKCRRDRYVFGREVERRKRQVETYNWDCSLQMQNYDYVMCDSKTLLNRHLACGTTFDRSIVNLNFELDEDKEKLCSSLTDYKHCVTPLIKNDACSGNKNLISRLLHFSRAVVGEYQTSCKTIAMKHMMQARQVEETACLPEDLREKVLTCQQSAYRTIRARDVHSETDICEELDLMKECIENALKETSCSRDITSMRVANDTTAESYARYNVKCRRF